MTKDKDDQTDHEIEPLLDDESFFRLMEAQYNDANRPEDKLASRRLEQRIFNPRRQSRLPMWLPAVLVAAVALFIIYPVGELTDPHQPRTKGEAHGLSVYIYQDNAMQPWTGKVRVGDIISFKALKADVVFYREPHQQQFQKVTGLQLDPQGFLKDQDGLFALQLEHQGELVVCLNRTPTTDSSHCLTLKID